ncbi:MAG: hypothetical protein D6698_14230, partial [Gammaproteobacteria bacterium]
MAAGDISIIGTEHLPKEKVLLIHYSVNTVGVWIYNICLCGYRPVCGDSWTIMIPNDQHPRHTDARIGQPLIVKIKGKRGTFAWNYGGIPGIKAEAFDDKHSYLVQLTMNKIAGCDPGIPPGIPGLTGSAGGGKNNPGITGKIYEPPRPIPRKGIDIIPGGPGTPWPDIPTIPPLPTGIPIYDFKPINPYDPPPIWDPIDPYQDYTGRPIDPPPIIRPITPLPFIPDGITYEGLPDKISDNPLPKAIDPPPLGGPVRDTVDITARPKPSLTFGQGGHSFDSVDSPYLGEGIPIDLSQHSPEPTKTSREVNSGEPYDPEPITPTVPTGVVNEPIGLDVAFKDAGNRTPVSALADELGYANQPDITYSAPLPSSENNTSPIFSKGVHTVDILLTRDVVPQGEFVGVVASFEPPDGGPMRVSATLYIQDSSGKTHVLANLDLTSASPGNPAEISAIARTDYLTIGTATVFVSFKDASGATVGASKADLGVVSPPTNEPSTPIRDVVSSDAPSQSLVDLTEISETGIVIPAKDLYLIYSATGSAPHNHSLVIYPLDNDEEKIYETQAYVYDLTDARTGTFSEQPVFRFVADPIYTAEGPTMLGGRPV